MKLFRIATITTALLLPLVLTACGGSTPSISATGRWQTITTSNGYLWLRINDNGGSLSGSFGVSTSSSSAPLSGTRNGGYLKLSFNSSSGRASFEGPMNGNTFESYTVICADSCTSANIDFTRTSSSSATDAVVAQSGDTSAKKLLEGAKRFFSLR
jgi:hypothetical protein